MKGEESKRMEKKGNVERKQRGEGRRNENKITKANRERETR